MMTPDKDYGQLVSEHIFMYRPRFGGDYEIMGVPEVLDKYGLTSVDQVIDLLGLMGDSSDNIPGCPVSVKRPPRNYWPNSERSKIFWRIPTS